MDWLDDQFYYRLFLSYSVKFHNIVCTVHAYQVTVYKLVQHYARAYTVKP